MQNKNLLSWKLYKLSLHTINQNDMFMLKMSQIRAKSRVNMYRLLKIFVWFDMILTIKHHSRSLHTLWPQTPCKKSIARSDQLTRRYTCTLDNGFFLTSTLRFNVKCESQSRTVGTTTWRSQQLYYIFYICLQLWCVSNMT